MGWETIYYGFVIYQTDAHWMIITIILLRTAILVGLTALAVARLRAWGHQNEKLKSSRLS